MTLVLVHLALYSITESYIYMYNISKLYQGFGHCETDANCVMLLSALTLAYECGYWNHRSAYFLFKVDMCIKYVKNINVEIWKKESRHIITC